MNEGAGRETAVSREEVSPTVARLREVFVPLAARLTAEDEPADLYTLVPDSGQLVPVE